MTQLTGVCETEEKKVATVVAIEVTHQVRDVYVN